MPSRLCDSDPTHLKRKKTKKKKANKIIYIVSSILIVIINVQMTCHVLNEVKFISRVSDKKNVSFVCLVKEKKKFFFFDSHIM